MKWIRVCDEKSLKERYIVGFDHYKDSNDNTSKRKLLVAKIHMAILSRIY
jgi:hypothetical protein